MPARYALPHEHHVMRYIPPARRYVDPDGIRQGPGEHSFQLRDDDEGGLSVTEVEHFGPMEAQTRAIAAAAFRDSQRSRSISANSLFAWASVKAVKDGASEFAKVVRVVHSPVLGNPGHAEIRHFTDDDLELLSYFAAEVFAEYAQASEMNVPGGLKAT